MEETLVAELVAPATEEPLATGPTSLGGGAHDEGNPRNVLGYEEAWAVVGSSQDPDEAGMKATRDAPSGTVVGPPVATKQANARDGAGDGAWTSRLSTAVTEEAASKAICCCRN
jgi:hypothetical protein